MGRIVVVGLFFVAVFVYFFVRGRAEMARSATRAASPVTAVLGSWAGKIVALTILISTFSAANSVILTAPRVFYAMAKDKLFFMMLAGVHPRFTTPAAPIIGPGVWSAVLVCAGELATLCPWQPRARCALSRQVACSKE